MRLLLQSALRGTNHLIMLLQNSSLLLNQRKKLTEVSSSLFDDPETILNWSFFAYCFLWYLIISTAKSSVDELDHFAMGTMRRSASASDAASKCREAEETKQFGVDDLDSFFSSGPRSSSVPKSRTATQVRTNDL